MRSGITDYNHPGSSILPNLPGDIGTQPPLTFKGRKDDLNQKKEDKLTSDLLHGCDVSGSAAPDVKTAPLVRAHVSRDDVSGNARGR